MDNKNETKISATDIEKGNFIRFRVAPWYAKRNGFVRIFKDENDGVDQGLITGVSNKAVRLSFCEIHEIREIWIPKSVFIYVYVLHDKIMRDWIKESEELNDDDLT